MVTINGYPIDVVETETHNLKSTVTKHPVEEGVDVSDHVRAEPRELTLGTGVVSDTPIGLVATDPSRTGVADGAKISQDAYSRLEAIWTAREPVSIVTSLKKYDNMILDDLSIPREHKDAGALVFTAHFIEVRIVQNKRVTVAIRNARGLGSKVPNAQVTLATVNKAKWNLRNSISRVSGATYAVTFSGDPASVISYSKAYGQPLVIDTTDTSGNAGSRQWAHYQSPQGNTVPDGYVQNGEYYPLATSGQGDNGDTE